jgi:hypothetical protein
MQCHHCHSQMQQTESVVEGRARQTWYRCPVCAASQTVSQPYQTTLLRIGNAQRCSCGGPDLVYRDRQIF